MPANLRMLQVINEEVRVSSKVIARNLKVEHKTLNDYILQNKEEFLQFGEVITLVESKSKEKPAITHVFLNKNQCDYFFKRLKNPQRFENFIRRLNLEFSFEETIQPLIEYATPINIDELIEQGILKRKSKNWYLSLYKLTDLPMPVIRKAIESKPSKSGVQLRFEGLTSKEMQEALKFVNSRKSRELLI